MFQLLLPEGRSTAGTRRSEECSFIINTVCKLLVFNNNKASPFSDMPTVVN